MDHVVAADAVPARDILVVEAMSPGNRIQGVAAFHRVRGGLARSGSASREER